MFSVSTGDSTKRIRSIITLKFTFLKDFGGGGNNLEDVSIHRFAVMHEDRWPNMNPPEIYLHRFPENITY